MKYGFVNRVGGRSACWALTVLCLALMLGGGWVLSAQAQDTLLLAYGTNAQGALSAEAPVMTYSFSGTTGDLVQVDVMRLSGGLDPMVDLIAPDQQTIASGHYNRLSVEYSDAHIALNLPQTGVYSLRVQALNNTTGEFLLELNGRSPVIATPLMPNVPLDVTIQPNAAQQYFSFDALDCPTHLIVFNPSAGQRFTFPYVVKVRDPQGQAVALLHGGDTFEDRVVVEPLSGTYEVEVWSSDPALAGTLTLSVSCGEGTPACGADTPAAASTAGEPCPSCPPCPAELGESPTLCDAFQVVIEESDDGIVVLTWPAVDGADHYTVSGVNLTTGDFVYGRRRESHDLYDVIELARWGGVPGDRYEFSVTAVLPDGTLTCTDTVVIDFSSDPVHWGPGVSCDIQLLEPRGVVANGPQTFSWTTVSGGETYFLDVWDHEGAWLAIETFDSSISITSLDMSEAAVGGTEPFTVRITVYDAARLEMCSDTISVTRAP